MKALLLLLSFFGAWPLASEGQPKPLQPFPLSAVTLLESPFKQAQEMDLAYMLALDPNRLLAPYLREAGLVPKVASYGNWENTGLDGHTGGHYLTALSLMYAATGNQEVKRRLDYMISELAACQQKNGNGYIGGVPGGEAMWQQVAQGKIDAGSFSLNDKWVPWYNLHKIFAGLRDAYLIGGNAQAKAMLVKLSDWCLQLTAGLSEAQMQRMLRSEHGGMNEVFADVAEITGNPVYLKLARDFSHQAILNPLLEQKDRLNGQHANTQIPKVIGFQRVAEVAGDPAWSEAAAFFWQTIVDNRTVSIGGNSVREHFHPADNFSSMVTSKEGPETCNTYNMLKLAKQLYLTKQEGRYLDYYERAMYNHILSSQHPERGGFVYFTPMRPMHYRVYSQPEEAFWCCVGSGLENHAKYGELVYAHNDRDLFVNLFLPSRLTWPEQGLTLTQQTIFPFTESTELRLDLKKARKFALHLRRPGWLAAKQLEVLVNNKVVKTTAAASSPYVRVERRWKSGDVVSLRLPMQTKAEQLPDGSDWVSFVHGPIVLAAAPTSRELVGIQADGSRMGHIAHGPEYAIEEVPVILSSGQDPAASIKPVPGKALTFTASALIPEGPYKDVELVPFFQVHDARYILYWPLSTPEKLEARKMAMREAEERKRALEASTIDQVAPGEQQPESDHNFKASQTESGVHQDRHWRYASGWFSYDLQDKTKEAKHLRVTYYGQDKGRQFDILVNGERLTTVELDGAKGDQFFDVDYPLPKRLVERAPNGKLTVKFEARPNSVAGGIFYLRLMK